MSEVTRKRLAMRAWRRGMREMDLVLGPFADARLQDMDAEQLALFDALLDENDQDLLAVLLGQRAAPPRFDALMAEVADFARGRFSNHA